MLFSKVRQKRIMHFSCQFQKQCSLQNYPVLKKLQYKSYHRIQFHLIIVFTKVILMHIYRACVHGLIQHRELRADKEAKTVAIPVNLMAG